MKKFGSFLALGMLLMIILSFLAVVMKSLFQYNSNALQETIIYIHASIFMLGIVYAFVHDKHVRIDIFYQKNSEFKKNKVNFYGTLLLLIPFFSFILFSSFTYVYASWSILESSSESGGLPFVYALKTFILVIPALMLILAVIKLVRNR